MGLIGFTIYSTLITLSFGAAHTAVNITAIIESCVGVDNRDFGAMGESMTLCPVQTGNLAEGKPSSQSSLYTSSAIGGPSRLAVDGNRNQIFANNSCTHTQPKSPPHWWQVDLQQTVAVTAVVIYNRGDCCGHRLKDFAVEVGVPDQNEQVEYRKCHYHRGSAGSIVNATCWPPLCGRYVRVIKQDDDDSTLTLCEVEVFGLVLEPQTSCTTSTADGTSTWSDQRVPTTTNCETATSPPTMSSDNPFPATTQEATYPTTDDFATPSESIPSTQKRETLTQQKETTPSSTEVSSTPETLDGPTTLPTQPVACSTVEDTPTWASASSSVASSTVPTQETSPFVASLSAQSASATSTHQLTTLTPHKSGSSTADVITPGSMTSQETSTPHKTDSLTADVTTPDSMTSQETSTPQETDSSKADLTTSGSMTSQKTGGPTNDITTTGSMTSRETSTSRESATATHVNSTQTRNPYAPGNSRETLPTKCCRCVFLASSNVAEHTILAAEQTMKEVRMSLLVNRTQVGKSIRKKTSAVDERTSSKMGGFAAVVILTSVFAFFLVLDCLGCIRGCASYIKRSNATSPFSREP